MAEKKFRAAAKRSTEPSPVADMSRSEVYGLQSRHNLGSLASQYKVPVWIDKEVDTTWTLWLKRGMLDINTAAPGLFLFPTQKKETSKVRVFNTEVNEPYTLGDIRSGDFAEVYLSYNWPEDEKKGTSTHELLHSLGFDHEHQRCDASRYLIHLSSSDQICSEDDIVGLTPFDPLSIMIYPEEADKYNRQDETDGQVPSVWKMKPGISQNKVLSELDKIGLNLLYRPCKGPKYNPFYSKSVPGMIYCARPVMQSHNCPGYNITDGNCGPNNWANCPACRTLKSPKVEEILKEEKWQGWSGLVYCGKEFGVQEPSHDGFCGPDNGTPCPGCANMLLNLE